MAESPASPIYDEIPDNGRFGLFATRPPAEHLVLGVCDLNDALGFVVASTHDHPFDVGPIAVLDPERLQLLLRRVAQWTAVRRRDGGPRYAVIADGTPAMRALVCDQAEHRTVLSLDGADRFAIAETIAAVLNASPASRPVRH